MNSIVNPVETTITFSMLIKEIQDFKPEGMPFDKTSEAWIKLANSINTCSEKGLTVKQIACLNVLKNLSGKLRGDVLTETRNSSYNEMLTVIAEFEKQEKGSHNIEEQH